MCGRFVATSSPRDLAERFDALVDDDVADAFEPDYNVTPRAAVPVVRPRPDGRAVERMRWGLVPSWAEEPRVGDRLINARAETVATSGAFAGAFRLRRCLVVADGFYEWPRASERSAAPGPVFLHRPGGEPLAFAGLWESWWDRALPPRASPLLTCTIVTTAANADLDGIHDRMPVVLGDDAWPVWLGDDADPGHLDALLAPAPAGTLVHHPVSTLVNSPAHNAPELLEPVERVDAVPLTLFD